MNICGKLSLNQISRQATKKLFSTQPNGCRYLSTFNSSFPLLSFKQYNYTSNLPQQNNIYATRLKYNLLRSFSTSTTTLDFYRRPKNSIIGGGLLGRMWSRVPDGVKLLGAVGIASSFILFVAVPVFIIVVPPIIIGGVFLVWLNRFLSRRQMQKRWSAITNSTLMYNPPHKRTLLSVPSPEEINSSLAHFEMNRIVDAFWTNEQGIADYFHVKNVDDLALGSLDAVEYSYNSESVVFADDFQLMVIQERSLYDKSKNDEIANVVLTLKCLDPPIYEGIDPSANITRGIVSIEIIPLKSFSKEFVLKTPSVSTNEHENGNDDDDDNDGFINVKGKTTIL